ncbi:MAG: rRNA adenine N(6)-methyltransferase family protein [Candidatus Dormiibacterota bacterium]
MSGATVSTSRRRRSWRDERRRSHGQNFLRDDRLPALIASSVGSGELVLDLGAGTGALTLPLARRGARVVAVESDATWAERLRTRVRDARLAGQVTVVEGDLLAVPPPATAYRVVSSVPFHLTTALLHRLLDDPRAGPERCDLIVQWEVARKRAAQPPDSLLSAIWAPWWETELVCRIPRTRFRPVPEVDAAWLAIRRRARPTLPSEMGAAFGDFLRSTWG